MGVAITSILPKKEITFEQLKGKKLAVDSSNVIYQFLASIRQPDGTPLMNNKGDITSHIVGLAARVPNLMERNIKLAFVFDGKPPELKFEESQRRRELKEKAQEKYEEAKKQEDTESMFKYSRQTIKLTKQMNEESKEFIKALGLPVIQAPSEAEAQASFMAEKGDVFAVVSQDIDSLLYSTPILIRNLTVSSKKRIRGTYIKINPEIYDLKHVLNTLEINKDQFLALSILVGTDFNPGGVFRVGPKTALKLVQEHKSFEKIFANVDAEFNWKKVYATFKSMPIMKNYQLNWQEPNLDKIQSILQKHDFSEERINKLLERLKPKPQKNLDKWFN
jgi:flap endonuclease-1